MLAIVESQADTAATTIGDRLRAIETWREQHDAETPAAAGGGRFYRLEGAELRTFEDRHVDLERPGQAFSREPSILVFISRHAGDTGPLLTGHFTGNFGSAEVGGHASTLAPPAPNARTALLAALDRYAPDDYETGIECTHHGPTDVQVPSLFAELGSDETAWGDEAGATAVARAVLDLRGVAPHRSRQLVGFGGGHYAPRFERIERETDWAVGHVAANWSLEESVDRAVIEQAFETSRTDLALLVGGQSALAETLESWGYEPVSETWVREVAGRDRDLVAAIERDLGAIDDGVRFGDQRTQEYAVVALPADLIDIAETADHERCRAVVAAQAVAYETVHGSSAIGTRAAVPTDWTRDQLATALVPILADEFESASLEGDEVVVVDREFDPAAARDRGVPEGPLFGTLAAGESVEVDGEHISPQTVHQVRTHRFPLQ